jgi:TRAP-type C4-dicarboxylate transport system substrate-binding protein
MLSWIWQAGGMASRGKPIVDPEDAAGLKVRGGSHEMDLILKEAGAAVVTMPSNEIRGAMQNRPDGCGDDLLVLADLLPPR